MQINQKLFSSNFSNKKQSNKRTENFKVQKMMSPTKEHKSTIRNPKKKFKGKNSEVKVNRNNPTKDSLQRIKNRKR
jgi:hypothetical protein